METSKCIPVNSVKGTSSDYRAGASLGREPNEEQVGPDRHQPTDSKKNLRKRWKRRVNRFGTWNVRTLLQKGKLENVMREMQRLKLKVLGLSEMRWNGTGSFMKEGHTVLYSGNDKHSNGVGFIVDRSCSKIQKAFSGYQIE